MRVAFVATVDLTAIHDDVDLSLQVDAFTRWLSERSPLSTFHNPPGVIGWNIDKRYLVDLHRRVRRRALALLP